MFLKVLTLKSDSEGAQPSDAFCIKWMLREHVYSAASKGKSTVKSVRDAFFYNFLFYMFKILISSYLERHLPKAARPLSFGIRSAA